MAMSSRETEIKLAFPSPETATRQLLAAGARETNPRTFEDNLLFDDADRSLHETGRLVRLRRYGAEVVLTFKGPAEEGTRHKVRVEHECTVGDGPTCARILAGLGLAPVYRYQKYRTIFDLAGVAASLDETPIGTYVELEGDAAAIDRAARALGRGDRDYIVATYRELQVRAAGGRDEAVGDLLMPADGAGATEWR